MNWTTEAEQVCRAAAGDDLAGVPVYICDADEVPAEFHPVGAAGYCAPWLSDALRPWLESIGRWAGAGFACIVAPRRLIPWNITIPELLEPLAVAAAIHELSHFLEFRAINRSLGVNELPLASAALVASCSDSLVPTVPEPWYLHGDSFIRAAIHLHYRVVAAGIHLSLPNIHVANDGYGLSAPHHYRNTLQVELEQRINEPISTILQSEPPKEFTMLLEADQAKHIAGTNHPDSSPHVCNSCVAFRRQSKRQNFTTIQKSNRQFCSDFLAQEKVRCENCGREWMIAHV